MQYIVLAIEHFPVTHLKIVMLAYPAMNFVIYIFWWHKPLNVNQPVQMSQKLDPRATVVAAGLNLMVQKNLSWPLVKEQVLETQT